MRNRLLVLATALAFAPLTVSLAVTAKEFHKIVPLDASGLLSITSHNGSVTVAPWNQPNVGIDVRIESSGFGDAEDVEKTKIVVRGSGREVDVDSDYDDVPSHSFLFGFGMAHTLPDVHYTIHMPPTARLKVSVHNSTVKTAGLAGPAQIETHNGDVRLSDHGGAAEVETHNGGVWIDFSRFAAPARIQTHNGSASVTIPSETRLSVVSDAHRSNPVTTDLPMTIRSTGSSWNGAVNGGGPELRFNTHNGSLRLTRR